MFRTLPYERTGRTILRLGVKMMTRLVEFLRDESGATAIEYGLIAAGISVAIIAAVMSLGTQLNSTFSTVTSQLASAGK
jgi:pilus assembly protein Flp/PilA